MKRAFITGITGQDGAYLAKFLLNKGYDVYGTFRRVSTPNYWRLQYLDIFDKIHLVPADMADQSSILNAIIYSNPDEIYHLAAQSFVEASFQTPYSTGLVTGLSIVSMLESLRKAKIDSKFYFAGTSELYGFSGNLKGKPLNEHAPFKPMSPYAAAKLYGYWITRIYREGYSLFVCNGILFNHESPLRGLEFVTRKIANGLAKIKLGVANTIRLGNINAYRDWGYAPEYVEAMWLMLQNNEPKDYVVATGETHSVQEFLELASQVAGVNYEDHLVIDNGLIRPLDLPALKGDYSKIKNEIGWVPRTDFRDLVKLMVDAEIKRWREYLDGKIFPWDAQNYMTENEDIFRGDVDGKQKISGQ